MLEPLNVNTEKLVPLTDLRVRLGVASTTVRRWVETGQDGIFLAARKIGGRWYTSEEAFQRFSDASTAAAIGDRPCSTTLANDASRNSVGVHRSPAVRNRDMEARHRETDRKARMTGLYGDDSIFRNSTAPKELLCDLHEFLEGWMPGGEEYPRGAYAAVRGGIFTYGSEILEGKHGKARSLQAAIAWVEGLDLLTFEVRKLRGVGPLFECEWECLLEDPAFVAKIRRPMSTVAATGG